MNINNWLCKHFDNEKKGYVTIGDVAKNPIWILCLLLWFVFTFIADFIGTVYYNDESGKGFVLSSNIRDVLFGYFVYIVIIITLYLLYYIGKIILNIKIAKCPLKEGDTK